MRNHISGWVALFGSLVCWVTDDHLSFVLFRFSLHRVRSPDMRMNPSFMTWKDGYEWMFPGTVSRVNVDGNLLVFCVFNVGVHFCSDL